jgi:hypothetical protein
MGLLHAREFLERLDDILCLAGFDLDENVGFGRHDALLSSMLNDE